MVVPVHQHIAGFIALVCLDLKEDIVNVSIKFCLKFIEIFCFAEIQLFDETDYLLSSYLPYKFFQSFLQRKYFQQFSIV